MIPATSGETFAAALVISKGDHVCVAVVANVAGLLLLTGEIIY
jgi:hypothetical protein